MADVATGTPPDSCGSLRAGSTAYAGRMVDALSVVHSDPEISGACRFSAARGCRFRRCSTTWKGERRSTRSSISSRRSQSNRRSPRSIWLGIPFWPVRVLLEENLPRPLAAELTGHEVSTVQAAGWSGTTNGELLRRAQGSFDVLLSMDRGLHHQLDLSALRLRIVVIRAPSNHRGHLKPRVGSMLNTLASLPPGQVREVGG